MKTIRILVFAIAIAAVHLIASVNGAQTDLPASNLKSGETIPPLSGTDQFGKSQDFDSLKGPNGLVLLFFRSADW